MAHIKKNVNKKGISYQVNIRPANHKPIYKTFKGEKALQKAKKWARVIEGQIADGTYIEAENTIVELPSDIESMTSEELMLYKREHIELMSDLIDYYKTYIAPTKYAHVNKYNVMYEWWKNKIGDYKVKAVTPAILSTCKQLLVSEKIIKNGVETTRSNNTINKYLMCISAVFTYAVKELEIIDINPMSKVDTMPKPDGRTRFLTEEEKPILASVCKKKSEILLLFYLLLLSTGGRYSEVLELQVENIDIKNSRIHYINTKNKTNRGVGIKESLLKFLLNYLEKENIKSGYIFLNKNRTKFLYMRGALQEAIKDAGLKDFHIHDLRHTFASKAAEEGASLLEIAILLGHKSLVMARRYSHLTQQHTDNIARKAAQAMNIDMYLS